MVALPATNPLITPDEFTVAIAELDDVQAPPGTVEVNVVLEPAQMACIPEIVPAEGAAVTVTVAVVVALAQPPVPFMV